MNAKNPSFIETDKDSAAWDTAITEHALSLDALAVALQTDLTSAILDANDSAW